MWTSRTITATSIQTTTLVSVIERGKAARTKDQKSTAGQSMVDEILNLKVLDPAMGSGHFLVAAVDYLALVLATDPYVETQATPEEDVTYWKRWAGLLGQLLLARGTNLAKAVNFQYPEEGSCSVMCRSQPDFVIAVV